MNTVNFDVLNPVTGEGQGEVAGLLVNSGKLNIGLMRPFIDSQGRACATVYTGGNPQDRESYKTVFVTNATLRRDEWKALDDAVLQVARQRLVGIQDLIDRGLVYNLGNAMGTTVFEWHTVSEGLEAVVTMDGITRASNDKLVFKHNYLPIPIIHADYQINLRMLSASRNLGNPIDTSYAEEAARKVTEKLEEMLFTNFSYSFGEKDARNRNTIYSYINHPDRTTITLTTPWDELMSGSTKYGRNIITDVLRMKEASLDCRHYGPWILYVSKNYEVVLDEDYDSVNPGVTIRERIKKIEGILDVKVADKLPDDNVVLVQMTSDTVRLINGLPLQNVEWGEEGKFITKYKVLTIQVPQIRSDANGYTGVVHLRPQF